MSLAGVHAAALFVILHDKRRPAVCPDKQTSKGNIPLIFSNRLLPFTPLDPSIRLRFQTLLAKLCAIPVD
jgi:hypothetical protein